MKTENKSEIAESLNEMANIARNVGMAPDRINAVCDSFKELLAACKKTLNDIETCTWRADDEAEIICKGLNAAIARVERGSGDAEGSAS